MFIPILVVGLLIGALIYQAFVIDRQAGEIQQYREIVSDPRIMSIIDEDGEFAENVPVDVANL